MLSRGTAPVFVVLLSVHGLAGSDSGIVRGVVRDQQGAAIAGATVELTCGCEHHRTTTGAAGEFAEPSLPATTCVVTARAPLFEPDSVSVEVAVAGETPALTLVLRAGRQNVQVTVTPTRGVEQDAFDVPVSLSIVSQRQIDARPYQLLPQVLREEPGILLQQTTSAQASPIIRGFTGQSNVYLIDGVRFRDALAMTIHAISFMANASAPNRAPCSKPSRESSSWRSTAPISAAAAPASTT